MSKTVTPPSPSSLPLWQLLIGCADAVAAVRQGQSLTDALAARPATERPGVQALSFAVLRRLGTAEALRNNEDVKEFYLGGGGEQRRSFKNLKSFKRRKRWL